MKPTDRSNAMTTSDKEPYEKPCLTARASLREITFECPDWQCSVKVPGPPA